MSVAYMTEMKLQNRVGTSQSTSWDVSDHDKRTATDTGASEQNASGAPKGSFGLYTTHVSWKSLTGAVFIVFAKPQWRAGRQAGE